MACFKGAMRTKAENADDDLQIVSHGTSITIHQDDKGAFLGKVSRDSPNSSSPAPEVVGTYGSVFEDEEDQPFSEDFDEDRMDEKVEDDLVSETTSSSEDEVEVSVEPSARVSEGVVSEDAGCFGLLFRPKKKRESGVDEPVVIVEDEGRHDEGDEKAVDGDGVDPNNQNNNPLPRRPALSVRDHDYTRVLPRDRAPGVQEGVAMDLAYAEEDGEGTKDVEEPKMTGDTGEIEGAYRGPETREEMPKVERGNDDFEMKRIRRITASLEKRKNVLPSPSWEPEKNTLQSPSWETEAKDKGIGVPNEDKTKRRTVREFFDDSPTGDEAKFLKTGKNLSREKYNSEKVTTKVENERGGGAGGEKGKRSSVGKKTEFVEGGEDFVLEQETVFDDRIELSVGKRPGVNVRVRERYHRCRVTPKNDDKPLFTLQRKVTDRVATREDGGTEKSRVIKRRFVRHGDVVARDKNGDESGGVRVALVKGDGKDVKAGDEMGDGQGRKNTDKGDGENNDESEKKDGGKGDGNTKVSDENIAGGGKKGDGSTGNSDDGQVLGKDFRKEGKDAALPEGYKMFATSDGSLTVDSVDGSAGVSVAKEAIEDMMEKEGFGVPFTSRSCNKSQELPPEGMDAEPPSSGCRAAKEDEAETIDADVLLKSRQCGTEEKTTDVVMTNIKDCIGEQSASDNELLVLDLVADKFGQVLEDCKSHESLESFASVATVPIKLLELCHVDASKFSIMKTKIR